MSGQEAFYFLSLSTAKMYSIGGRQADYFLNDNGNHRKTCPSATFSTTNAT